LKKDRHYNGQKKNNCRYNTVKKTEDSATRIPQRKTGVNASTPPG
jgi:hypothetical protein